jgi:hypothetical protein
MFSPVFAKMIDTMRELGNRMNTNDLQRQIGMTSADLQKESLRFDQARRQLVKSMMEFNNASEDLTRQFQLCAR